MEEDFIYVKFNGDISFPIHYKIKTTEDFIRAVENHINIMPSFLEVLDVYTWKKKNKFYHVPHYFEEILKAVDIPYEQITAREAKKEKICELNVQTFGEKLNNSEQIFTE